MKPGVSLEKAEHLFNVQWLRPLLTHFIISYKKKSTVSI